MPERSKKRGSAEASSAKNSPPNDRLSRRTFLAAGGSVAAASLLAPPVPFRMPAGPGDAPEPADRLEHAESTTWPAADCYEGPQYKRRGLNAMIKITEGDYDDAITCLHEHLEEYPGDPEFFYGLAVAHSQKEEMAEALHRTRQALQAGLPLGRFLAGPRDLLAPLTETPAFQDLVSGHPFAGRVHGPLLGAVTDRSARFWVRTAREATFQVVLRPAGEHEVADKPLRSAPVQTQQADDYTAVARLDGLSPDTLYHYRLVIGGAEAAGQWAFRTFPPPGQPAVFDVGFGGCAGYTPWHEHIWQRIAAYNFPAFILSGDNVYIDQPERPRIQQYCYYRRQSRPEFQAFTAGSSIFAIWDDHDFATDDSWGGPRPHHPAWKPKVWRRFKNNWNNPSYGGGEEHPGVWHDFSIADVDFFLLDDRYYRTGPEADEASMLGSAQKEWLFDRLHASTGTFKFIVSSVAWADGVKPGSADPWQGYEGEREELFSFLEANDVGGVVLLSGDRHRADIWKIDRADGYDLYEFENARLTNIHTHDRLPGALFSYNDKCTFGRLAFDTTRADPEVTYQIINIDDEVVHAFTLRRSQLTPPG